MNYNPTPLPLTPKYKPSKPSQQSPKLHQWLPNSPNRFLELSTLLAFTSLLLVSSPPLHLHRLLPNRRIFPPWDLHLSRHFCSHTPFYQLNLMESNRSVSIRSGSESTGPVARLTLQEPATEHRPRWHRCFRDAIMSTGSLLWINLVEKELINSK